MIKEQYTPAATKRPHEAEKSLRTKLKMYNSNVLSTLLYRAQTWQLKQTEEKMLLTASVHKLFLESDGSNKLPTRRSAWQPTIHLYQTPSGRDDSGFCVLDMAPSSRDWQNKWPIGNLSSKLLTTEWWTIQQIHTMNRGIYYSKAPYKGQTKLMFFE